jgi:hypothetical protein
MMWGTYTPYDVRHEKGKEGVAGEMGQWLRLEIKRYTRCAKVDMRYIMLIFAEVRYWTNLSFQGCCVWHLLQYRLISQPTKLNKQLFPLDLWNVEQFSCEHVFIMYGRDHKGIMQFWLGRSPL